MAIIFYSETPCYIKIDGNYLGKVTKNPRILNDIKKESFLTFIPLLNGFHSIETTLLDAFNLKVFNLFSDTIIIPVFEKKRNLPYKLICQKNFKLYSGNLLVTVIQDGSFKFYLDGKISYLDELPFNVENIDVKEINNVVFIIFYGIKTIIFAFDINANKLIYKNFLNDFNVADCFTTCTRYDTLLPVNIIEKYDYNFNLLSKDFEFIKKPHEINSKLLSVAFFELVALNADVKFLLSNDLKTREKEIYEFIGKPIAVFPYYKDISKTVVILNDRASVYSLTFLGGVISNILEE